MLGAEKYKHRPTERPSAFEGWDDVPLFMKTLPKEFGGQGDVSDTTALDALQSLVYDGDPSEIAANFRAQANELFKERKFSDAVGFYTRALDEVGKDLPVDERRTLWANRSAANLELSASLSLSTSSVTRQLMLSQRTTANA